VNVNAFKERWLEAVPAHRRQGFLPEGFFEAWAAATLAVEPLADVRAQSTVRAPNGAVLDTREYWAKGCAIYPPEELTVPYLMVHGEWDHDVTLDMAKAHFVAHSHAAYKRWVEIGESTHMLPLERNRLHAVDALAQFFDEDLARDD
jgi:fermentation-respiration switch protein FrsA (DUF1100 family)